ncbi:protein of unknown function DUF574 [Actinobacteria bacterium OK074]|nr:protein of unknown function DUF574 [Actinobacteria bacterium OK074]
MTGPDEAPSRIDTSYPHPARLYNYWLGGKDHYPVDEEMGRKILALDPNARRGAQANRRFMHRAVRAVGDAGLRQFLDIGAGMPLEPNLHEIAQTVDPRARIVYADNDSVVLRHAEALMHSTPEGSTEYVQADVHDPDALLELASHSLDFDRPVALSLLSMTHYLADGTDGEDVYGLIKRYVDALAPGSHLLLSQVTADMNPAELAGSTAVLEQSGTHFHPRTRAEITRFFDGLELLAPGVVPVLEWRPEPEDIVAASEGIAPLYVAVGRKP